MNRLHITIRIIAAILVASMCLQDVVWANPDCIKDLSSHSLQIPSFLTHNEEANLYTSLTIISASTAKYLKTFDHQFRNVVKGTEYVLNFRREDRDGYACAKVIPSEGGQPEHLIVPCWITPAGRKPLQYEASINLKNPLDVSLKRLKDGRVIFGGPDAPQVPDAAAERDRLVHELKSCVPGHEPFFEEIFSTVYKASKDMVATRIDGQRHGLQLMKFLDAIFNRAKKRPDYRNDTRLVFLRAGADPLYEMAMTMARVEPSLFPADRIHSVWATVRHLEAMTKDPTQASYFVKYLYDQGILTSDTKRIIFVDTDSRVNAVMGTELIIYKTLMDRKVIDETNARFPGLGLKAWNTGDDREAEMFYLYLQNIDPSIVEKRCRGWGLDPSDYNKRMRITNFAGLKDVEDAYEIGKEWWYSVDAMLKDESVGDKFVLQDGKAVPDGRAGPYNQPYAGIELKIARIIDYAGVIIQTLNVLEARGDDVSGETERYIAAMRRELESLKGSLKGSDPSFEKVLKTVAANAPQAPDADKINWVPVREAGTDPQSGEEIKFVGNILNGLTAMHKAEYKGKVYWAKYARGEGDDERIISPQAEILSYLNRLGFEGICEAEHFLEVEFKDGLKRKVILFKEFPAGDTLQTMLSRTSEKDAIGVMLQASGIIKRLHKAGVYHWDIRPENIWRTNEGKIMVFDFDFAFRTKEECLRRGLDISYSVRYESMSRDMRDRGVNDNFSPSAADEVYSLAMVLLHMIRGAYLFKSGTSREYANDHLMRLKDDGSVSPQLKGILQKALSDGKSEYTTVDEFIRALEDCRRAPPAGSAPASNGTVGGGGGGRTSYERFNLDNPFGTRRRRGFRFGESSDKVDELIHKIGGGSSSSVNGEEPGSGGVAKPQTTVSRTDESSVVLTQEREKAFKKVIINVALGAMALFLLTAPQVGRYFYSPYIHVLILGGGGLVASVFFVIALVNYLKFLKLEKVCKSLVLDSKRQSAAAELSQNSVLLSEESAQKILSCLDPVDSRESFVSFVKSLPPLDKEQKPIDLNDGLGFCLSGIYFNTLMGNFPTLLIRLFYKGESCGYVRLRIYEKRAEKPRLLIDYIEVSDKLQENNLSHRLIQIAAGLSVKAKLFSLIADATLVEAVIRFSKEGFSAIDQDIDKLIKDTVAEGQHIREKNARQKFYTRRLLRSLISCGSIPMILEVPTTAPAQPPAGGAAPNGTAGGGSSSSINEGEPGSGGVAKPQAPVAEYQANLLNDRVPVFIILSMPGTDNAALTQAFAKRVGLPVVDVEDLIKKKRAVDSAAKLGAYEIYDGLLKAELNGIRDGGFVICDTPRDPDSLNRIKELIRRKGGDVNAIIYHEVDRETARSSYIDKLGAEGRAVPPSRKLSEAIRGYEGRIVSQLEEWKRAVPVFTVSGTMGEDGMVRAVFDGLMKHNMIEPVSSGKGIMGDEYPLWGPEQEFPKLPGEYYAPHKPGKIPVFVLVGVPGTRINDAAEYLNWMTGLPVIDMERLYIEEALNEPGVKPAIPHVYGDLLRRRLKDIPLGRGVIICDSPRSTESMHSLEETLREMGCDVTAVINLNIGTVIAENRELRKDIGYKGESALTRQVLKKRIRISRVCIDKHIEEWKRRDVLLAFNDEMNFGRLCIKLINDLGDKGKIVRMPTGGRKVKPILLTAEEMRRGIKHSGELTGELTDLVAKFIVREGIVTGAEYTGDASHVLEAGRRYLDSVGKGPTASSGGFFVTFEGKEVIGIASCSLLSPATRKRAGYDAVIGEVLHVAPSYRQLGVENMLVSAAEDLIRREGANNYMAVVSDTLSTQQFWTTHIPRQYQQLGEDGVISYGILPLGTRKAGNETRGRKISPTATPQPPARGAPPKAGMQPMIQPSTELDYEKIRKALAAMKPCLWNRCKYSMGEDGILRFTGNTLSSGSFVELLNAAAPVLAGNIEKLQKHSPISNEVAWSVKDLGASSDNVHRIMAVKNCPFASVRNVKDDMVLIDFAWIKILRRYLNDERFGEVVKWLISERLFHEVFHANTETNQTIRDIYYQGLVTPELQGKINAFFNLPDVKASGIARKTKARFKFLEEQAGRLKASGKIWIPGIKDFVGLYDVPIGLEKGSYQPMVGPQEPQTPVTVSLRAMAQTFFEKVWKNRVIIAKALVSMSFLSISLYCLLSFTLPGTANKALRSYIIFALLVPIGAIFGEAIKLKDEGKPEVRWKDLDKDKLKVIFALAIFVFAWFWPRTYDRWDPLPGCLYGVADQVYTGLISITLVFFFTEFYKRIRSSGKGWSRENIWTTAKETIRVQLPNYRIMLIAGFIFWIPVLGTLFSLDLSDTARNILIGGILQPSFSLLNIYMAYKKADAVKEIKLKRWACVAAPAVAIYNLIFVPQFITWYFVLIAFAAEIIVLLLGFKKAAAASKPTAPQGEPTEAAKARFAADLWLVKNRFPNVHDFGRLREKDDDAVNIFYIDKAPRILPESGAYQCNYLFAYDAATKIGAVAHVDFSFSKMQHKELVRAIEEGVQCMREALRMAGAESQHLQFLIVRRHFDGESRGNIERLSIANQDLLKESLTNLGIAHQTISIEVNQIHLDLGSGKVVDAPGKELWCFEGPATAGGPALFVDPRDGKVRELSQNEHKVLNIALNELVFVEKDPRKVAELKSNTIRALIGEELLTSVNSRGPPLSLHVIDDSALENKLPGGYKYLAKGLITHAGTWRHPATGEKQANNIFMTLSVYKTLLKFPAEELETWGKHEIEHLLYREKPIDKELSPDEIALAEKIFKTRNEYRRVAELVSRAFPRDPRREERQMEELLIGAYNPELTSDQVAERAARSSIIATPPECRDADCLSAYIDELIADINYEKEGDEKVSLSDILADPLKYRHRFMRPLYKLLSKRLSEDFTGAERFISLMRALDDKLPDEMAKSPSPLLDAFLKIRKNDKTSEASFDFYGLLFFCLKPHENYLKHIYGEFIKTRPVSQIALAREGFSYHTRGDSIITLYGQTYLFKGWKSRYRKSLHKLVESSPHDVKKDPNNSEKIRKAIFILNRLRRNRNIPENERMAIKKRISYFRRYGTVVELDMNTNLLFSDPDHNVVRLIHSGRSRHILYMSKHYLDSLKLDSPEDMKKLAAWLNYGMRFLGIYDTMTNAKATPSETQRALLGYTLRFFEQEDDCHLFTPQELQKQLAGLMAEDAAIKYTAVLRDAIEDEKRARAFLRKDTKDKLPYDNKLGETIKIFKHLMYHYEGMGMHKWAQKAFDGMAEATREFQKSDLAGMRSTQFQHDLLFAALRFAHLDSFISNLRIFWTGLGYPNRIRRQEIELPRPLAANAKVVIGRALNVLVEVMGSDPDKGPKIRRAKKKADRILSKDWLSDLSVADINYSTEGDRVIFKDIIGDSDIRKEDEIEEKYQDPRAIANELFQEFEKKNKSDCTDFSILPARQDICDSIRRLVESGHNILPQEKALIERALRIFLNNAPRILKFDSVVLPREGSEEEAKNWLLGFNTSPRASAAPEDRLLQEIQKIFWRKYPNSILVSSQVLEKIRSSSNDKMLLLEYLFSVMMHPYVSRSMLRYLRREIFHKNYRSPYGKPEVRELEAILEGVIKEAAKARPAGSIKHVFEYLCDNKEISKASPISALKLAEDLDLSYETIKYDLRALYYHLHLIDRVDGKGKSARYYVPESIKKKKDVIMPILAGFRGKKLRPKVKLLKTVYKSKIKPILLSLKDYYDTRPVNAKLLHRAYVRHDMMVKEAVNPRDRAMRAIYGGGGVDISNFLLSTNATDAYFISRYYGLSKDNLMILQDENFLKGGYSASLNAPYNRYYEKFKYGYAYNVDLVKPEDIVAALAFELNAMGVTTVKVDLNGSRPRIRFRWKYKDGEERDYAITFVDADITCAGEYKDIFEKGNIDIYYQRAGEQIPFSYSQWDSFIKEINKHLNPGGFSITDDYAHGGEFVDLSRNFPLQFSEITIPNSGRVEKAVLDQRVRAHPGFARGGDSIRYGWYVRVRQKPLPQALAAPPTPAPAEKLLSLLDLKDPKNVPGVKIVREEEKFGGRVCRISIPRYSNSSEIPTRGVGLLKAALCNPAMFDFTTLDLLYNKRGNLIAVFPVLTEAEKRKSEYVMDARYVDLSYYYFNIPPIGDPTAKAQWQNFYEEVKKDKEIIASYRSGDDCVAKQVLGGISWSPYVYLEMDKKGGWRALPLFDVTENTFNFNPEVIPDNPGPDKHQIIIPVFPTVYPPDMITDSDYYRLLYEKIGHGHNVLVVGPGSGSDAWVASLRTGRKIYSVGVNPFEIANLEVTAAIAGFEVETKLGDNIISESGKPHFEGMTFDRVIWDMPEYHHKKDAAKEPTPGIQPQVFEHYWDGDNNGAVLKRFAKGLGFVLARDGLAIVWNREHLVPGAAASKQNVVAEILRSAGEVETIPSIANYSIYIVRPGGKPQNKVWVTTDIEHHDPEKFMYTVKMHDPGRLLYPEHHRGAAEYYSASVIGEDNLATLIEDSPSHSNMGVILEFYDDDVVAVLKHMNKNIYGVRKLSDTLPGFIEEHLAADAGNVLYESVTRKRKLNVNPRTLIEESKSPVPSSYAQNNEVVIKNSPSLRVSGAILIARNDFKFETTLDALEQYKGNRELLAAIKSGLPVVIVAEAGADLTAAENEFMHRYYTTHKRVSAGLFMPAPAADGSPAPEATSPQAPSGKAARDKIVKVDIEKVKETVRSFGLKTCLASACLLIYFLRSLGQKAVLIGMYRDNEDMPFQYLVRTERWGDIDILPDSSENADYSRTVETGESDYERGLSYLRSIGVIGRANQILISLAPPAPAPAASVGKAVPDSGSPETVASPADYPRISKKLEVLKVDLKSEENKLIITAKYKGTRKVETFTLDISSRAPLTAEDRRDILDWVKKKHRALTRKIIRLFPQNIPLYQFTNPVEDLLGLASKRPDLIAICGDLYEKMRISVFHEICEYLILHGVMSLKLKKGNLEIWLQGNEEAIVINAAIALRSLQKGEDEYKEEWAGWDEGKLNEPENRHYLIRILQREILSKDIDECLTGQIRKCQPIPIARRGFLAAGLAASLFSGGIISILERMGGEGGLGSVGTGSKPLDPHAALQEWFRGLPGRHSISPDEFRRWEEALAEQSRLHELSLLKKYEGLLNERLELWPLKEFCKKLEIEQARYEYQKAYEGYLMADEWSADYYLTLMVDAEKRLEQLSSEKTNRAADRKREYRIIGIVKANLRKSSKGIAGLSRSKRPNIIVMVENIETGSRDTLIIPLPKKTLGEAVDDFTRDLNAALPTAQPPTATQSPGPAAQNPPAPAMDKPHRRGGEQKGMPATLLEEMHRGRGVYSDKPKTSEQLWKAAKRRGGNNSIWTIRRELKALQDCGLVRSVRDGRHMRYYLIGWLKRVNIEKFIEDNPVLGEKAALSDEDASSVLLNILPSANKSGFSHDDKVALFAHALLKWAELPGKKKDKLFVQPIWDRDNSMLSRLNAKNELVTLTPEVIEKLKGSDPSFEKVLKTAGAPAAESEVAIEWLAKPSVELKRAVDRTLQLEDVDKLLRRMKQEKIYFWLMPDAKTAASIVVNDLYRPTLRDALGQDREESIPNGSYLVILPPYFKSCSPEYQRVALKHEFYHFIYQILEREKEKENALISGMEHMKNVQDRKFTNLLLDTFRETYLIRSMIRGGDKKDAVEYCKFRLTPQNIEQDESEDDSSNLLMLGRIAFLYSTFVLSFRLENEAGTAAEFEKEVDKFFAADVILPDALASAKFFAEKLVSGVPEGAAFPDKSLIDILREALKAIEAPATAPHDQSSRAAPDETAQEALPRKKQQNVTYFIYHGRQARMNSVITPYDDRDGFRYSSRFYIKDKFVGRINWGAEKDEVKLFACSSFEVVRNMTSYGFRMEMFLMILAACLKEREERGLNPVESVSVIYTINPETHDRDILRLEPLRQLLESFGFKHVEETPGKGGVFRASLKEIQALIDHGLKNEPKQSGRAIPSGPAPFMREDLANPKEAAENFVEAILSRHLMKKRVVLALESELGGAHRAYLMKFFEELKRLKRSEKYGKLLSNLEIIRNRKAKNLPAALSGYIDKPEENAVFVFARAEVRQVLKSIESKVSTTYIEEGDFNKDPTAYYYYPLVEIITATITRHMKIEDLNKIKEALKNVGVEMNTDPLSENILIFKLLPSAIKYDHEHELVIRYSMLIEALRQA